MPRFVSTVAAAILPHALVGMVPSPSGILQTSTAVLSGIVSSWTRQHGGLASMPRAARREHLTKLVVGCIEEVTGITPCNFDEPLMVLGLDSVSAVEFHNLLQTRLTGVKIPETLIFDHPTINAIVEFFDQSFEGQANTYALSMSENSDASSFVINGLACRLPGSSNSALQYWEMLLAQTNGISEIPFDRFDVDAYFDPSPSIGKMYVRHAGLIDDVDFFDPAFFGISMGEAMMMDPQQRHILEVGYWALVDAGLDKKTLVGSRTGVFVGMSTNDFSMLSTDLEGAYLGTGMAYSIAANRVSYVLGLKGPSMSCDTACSSSLVATYVCQRSLQSADCERALVAGVNLCLAARNFVNFCAARMLSADGQCKTFDEAANGYVRGEGCGAVVLERSENASGEAYAQIQGCAVNQDGRTANLTAPNGPSQTDVIARALQHAGLPPAALAYIECHGTGTALGDPIEVGAQKALLAPGRTEPLILGAVKTAIGHLEAAAGIAGMVKAVLALHHQQVPGNRNLRTLNPHMDLEGYPVLFPTSSTPLHPTGGESRAVAGVSSFGFGGTNAHVILRQASHSNGSVMSRQRQGKRIAMIFTGQGAQTPNMGSALFLSDPVYAAALQECACILDPLLPRPLLTVLLPALFPHSAPVTEIHETRYAQPALFAMEYALAKVLMSSGIQPTVVMGHSLGEIVAACIAGVMSLEDALLLVIERARLMQEQPSGGGMIALFASGAEVSAALPTVADASVSIAAVNGPKMTVVAGPLRSLTEVVEATGWGHQRLEVSHAFHSPLMGGVAKSLQSVMSSCVLHPPPATPQLISNTTGTWATPAVASTSYWIQHILKPVQFQTGIMTVAGAADLVVEVGPKATLTHMANRVIPEERRNGLIFATCLDARGTVDLKGILSLAPGFTAGGPEYRRQAVPYRRTQPHPFLQQSISGAGGLPAYFDLRIGNRLRHLLSDHVVLDEIVFPAAAYIEMVCAAAHRRRGPRFTLEHIALERPLIMDPDDFDACRTLLTCEFEENEGFRVLSTKGNPNESVLHVSGLLSPALPRGSADWTALLTRCPTEMNAGVLYSQLKAVGLQYGPEFQTVKRVWVGDGEALGLLQATPNMCRGFGVCPTLIDGSLHLASALAMAMGRDTRLFVPVRVTQVVVHGPGGPAMKAHLQLLPGDTSDQMEVTVVLMDLNDQLVMELRAVRLKHVKSLGPTGHETNTFVVKWEEAPLDLALEGTTTTRQWLVMADESDPLASQIITLFPGKCRIVPPQLPAPSLDQGVHGVVVLAPLNSVADEMATLEIVLRTAQASVLQFTDRSMPMPRILVITRCTQPVGDTAVQVSHAGLWGMARCARAEYPQLGWGCLDLGTEEAEDTENVARAVVKGMVGESCQGDMEPEVALRGSARYVARLVPFEMSVVTPTPVLQSNGTYVITGGLGGLGLITAKWMASEGAGHLVLISQSGQVKDGLTEEWQQLTATAASVHVLACDVAAEDFPIKLQEVTAGLPPVRGVVHAAGVLQDAAFLKQTPEKVKVVWRPKVAGAWHLHRYTKEMDLDFFLLFSSIAALIGSPGQANYGAANAAIDALAHMRCRAGLPATSIQWGAWADVGMAARYAKDVVNRLERLGLRPITVPMGLAALTLLLGTTKAQVAVLKPNVPRLVQSIPNALPHAVPLFRAYLAAPPPPKVTSGGRLLAEVAGMADAERAQYVQQWVVASVKEATGITPESGVSLIDQGMDSVALMEFRNLLQQRVGRAGTIPVEVIAQNPTIEAITALVLQAMADTGTTALPTQPAPTSASDPPYQYPSIASIPASLNDFSEWPEYLFLQQSLMRMEETGRNVFFRPHESLTRNTTIIDGEEVTTYSNYNYIGMAGHPEVTAAAKTAIDTYGTTVSASRLAGGEKPLHHQLEQALSTLLGVEDTIVMLGGHTTNVNTIGHLCGAEDLVLHDAFAHNSIVQGCVLSGSKRLAFPHNDHVQLDRMLSTLRLRYRRVLIIIEGVYSVDGDMPDLPAFIEVKNRHKALLMVDEAHSIGVLGCTGGGIREHFNVEASKVDIWMGTLSKAFASAGGYIAGSHALVQYLKYTAPGFVFSVGLSPPNTAAALTSIQVMLREPERLQLLRERSNQFCALAKERGLDIGSSKDTPVVPIIVGPTADCIRLSQDLLRLHRIHVHPMVYPAVPEDKARLRFFITCVHTEEQLVRTANAVQQELQRIRTETSAATR